MKARKKAGKKMPDMRTEILAGLTTFFTVSYILLINPQILSFAGLPEGEVFVATALSAAIATLLMGLYVNRPFALAAGMGL
ncbi:MAG TPA: NCS2 family permease, partial [Chromatiaceae bacterium]|nr:NCS2 family permease [Chromatiaceae bacterium]